jgi:hypothetical protein
MDVLAHARELSVRADHILAHVLRVRAGVANALDALELVEPAQELREAGALAQVAPVGVDVLPEQRHLLDTVGRHRRDLRHELLGRAAHLASTRRGHDAVGARTVAAHADLHPALEAALAVRRKVAGEALELEEALRGERLARQELRELMHLAGAERHINEREALEHLLLQRLRPAATDPHDALRLLALEALGLAQMRDEAAVRGLTDRARVEQDQIRLLACAGLRVAERLEHALHALGVVLVHLAAEGREVVVKLQCGALGHRASLGELPAIVGR